MLHLFQHATTVSDIFFFHKKLTSHTGVQPLLAVPNKDKSQRLLSDSTVQPPRSTTLLMRSFYCTNANQTTTYPFSLVLLRTYWLPVTIDTISCSQRDTLHMLLYITEQSYHIHKKHRQVLTFHPCSSPACDRKMASV